MHELFDSDDYLEEAMIKKLLFLF